MGDERRPSDTAGRQGAPAGDPSPSKLGSEPGSLSVNEPRGLEHRRREQGAALTEAEHDAYWRRSFADRPYADPDLGYEHYRPAFRYGWEARSRYGESRFEEVEAELRAAWDEAAARMEWDQALPAVRDAFTRPPGTGPSNTGTSTPGNPLA